MRVPRPEYPRPQLVRENWMNLNGEWQFEADNSRIGMERAFYQREELNGKIIVPFCPESRLSGVENVDFMNAVWYRREVELPEAWTGKQILLHFGAVDYAARVYVNGSLAGTHRGGYTPFCFNITAYLRPGKNSIVVYAEDDVRSGNQPAGKQSGKYASAGCYYTRTTGIWQTVWLEPVDTVSIRNVKYRSNVSACQVLTKIQLAGTWVQCRGGDGSLL